MLYSQEILCTTANIFTQQNEYVLQPFMTTLSTYTQTLINFKHDNYGLNPNWCTIILQHHTWHLPRQNINHLQHNVHIYTCAWPIIYISIYERLLFSNEYIYMLWREHWFCLIPKYETSKIVFTNKKSVFPKYINGWDDVLRDLSFFILKNIYLSISQQ